MPRFALPARVFRNEWIFQRPWYWPVVRATREAEQIGELT